MENHGDDECKYSVEVVDRFHCAHIYVLIIFQAHFMPGRIVNIIENIVIAGSSNHNSDTI